MGKRNKNKTTEPEDNARNKKRKHLIGDASTGDVNEPVEEKKNNVANKSKQNLNVENKQTNKINKHLDVNNADDDLVCGPSKGKRKKSDKNINDSMPQNKKIVFDDDGQVENSSQKSKNENIDKTKQFLSGEEAAVTEEEIDRFCDELNEEDNVQFENWVKLIEEKLKPNRKNKST